MAYTIPMVRLMSGVYTMGTRTKVTLLWYSKASGFRRIQAPSAPILTPSEFIVTVHGESYRVKVAGAGHKVEGKRPFFLKIDGRLEEVMVESLTEVIPSTAGQIEAGPTTSSVRPKAQKEGDVTTPIPGKVTSIKVSEGDRVVAGDTVLTVEAMKMENEIHTPIDGVVKKIYVKVGDSVNPDETLVVVEKE
ncbi:MAG: biotin/lipoyl-binding protein [Deltaproteobacteria bacterium]|nr:biotin/lipoyl-binding protein [Deltaproteobacteria bacterium]